MGARREAPLSNLELARILSFGDHELAVRSTRAALRVRAGDGKLWQLLGVALAALGRLREAQAALGRALQLLPGDAELLGNQAALRQQTLRAAIGEVDAALQRGDKAGALRLARRAVAAWPESAGCHDALCVTLAAAGAVEEAVRCGRRAVDLDPAHVQYGVNLAACLSVAGLADEALAQRRRLFELACGQVENCRLLAHGAAEAGDPALAAHYCRHGAAEPPRDLGLHSQMLYYMTLDGNVSPDSLAAAHRHYGACVEQAVGGAAWTHQRSAPTSRPLRVGFVSADLHHHPVAGFIAPVWAALDRRVVEVWVYSVGKEEDETTARLRLVADRWHDAAALTDAELAARIHADAIDVLFDLSGHTSGHRLPCFARKPAPLQVTWIGYPNTTGLTAMDYALCDPFNAPPGLYEAGYVEKFARIPCSGTFEPLGELPAVGPLPALQRGAICFGSFNVLRKIGPAVLDAWARVLHATPGSQLLVGHVEDESGAARLRQALSCRGIGGERLRLCPPRPLADYLALHAEVDMLLDAWPYTGGTTTNYALAMGVPVVTLRGPSRAHCQSAGVLGRIGLQDWVADDVDGFVQLATAKASDLAALAALRAGLRERWRDTPLRRPVTVARGLEAAVQEMWRRWCDGLPAEHFQVELDMPGGRP